MKKTIINTTVTILEYCKLNCQWNELGSVNGQCSLTLYKSSKNVYRFVAFKIINAEVVLNTLLFPSMHYNETSLTFHQWIDNSLSVYGLSFTDSTEAKKFSSTVSFVLQSLNEIQSPPPAQINYYGFKSLPRQRNDKIESTEFHSGNCTSHPNFEMDIYPNARTLPRGKDIDSKSHINDDNVSFNRKPQITALKPSSSPTVNKKLKGAKMGSTNTLQTLGMDISDKTYHTVNLLNDKYGKNANKYFKPPIPLINGKDYHWSLAVSNKFTNQNRATPEDLENLRIRLISDVILNLESMKNEIISSIVCKI